MKNYLFTLLTLVIFSLTFITACDNDESEEEMTLDTSVFSCKIDGVLWESDTILYSVFFVVDYQTGAFERSYRLGGRSIDGSRIEIIITDYTLDSTAISCVDAINFFGTNHPN